MNFVYFLTIAGFFSYTQTQIIPENCTFSEVAIVIDVSGSIVNDFDTELEFARILSSTIGISPTGNRIGFAKFSSDANVEFFCDAYTDVRALNAHIRRIVHTGGNTNIISGLNQGVNILTSNGCGSRTAGVASRVIVLMTDGVHNTPSGTVGQLITRANEIRALNITILAVALGNGADLSQLNQIADLVVQAHFGDVLDGLLVQNITEHICNEPCPEGLFNGRFCNITISPCDLCLNGATCMEEEGDGLLARCWCAPGYRGRFCETVKVPDIWTGVTASPTPTPECVPNSFCVNQESKNYRHPANADCFISCSFGAIATCQCCPIGTTYNIICEECLLPDREEEGCPDHIEDITSTPPTAITQCTNIMITYPWGGNFKNDQDLTDRTFLQCHWGGGRLITCPGGTFWCQLTATTGYCGHSPQNAGK